MRPSDPQLSAKKESEFRLPKESLRRLENVKSKEADEARGSNHYVAIEGQG